MRILLFLPAIILIFALPGKFKLGAAELNQGQELAIFRGNILAAPASSKGLSKPAPSPF
jgi:hypothetical protein